MTLAEVRAHASARLAAWKVPEEVVVVDDLPRTPMDKVDRREAARAALGTSA